MTKIKYSYQNKSKSRPYVLSIFSENCDNFLLYLCFFQVQMGSVSKIKRSQLRLALLFQKPLIKGKILVKVSVVAHFKLAFFLALMSFFTFSDNFFDFGPIFKCHTQKMEIINWISRCRTLYWIFCKKNSLKEIKYSRNSLDLENCWYGHQQPYIISFRFLQISGHFRITQENQNQLIQRRKISCNWAKKIFLDYLNRKDS